MNETSQIPSDPLQIPPVREVNTQAPLRWLAAGWNDFRRAGTPSLLHGIIVSMVSLIILAITMIHWELLPGAVSGFVLTGPFLATGLYALSRRLETGKPTSLKDAINAWSQGSRCLFNFGLLLVLAATAWVVFSVVMFHFFIDANIETPLDFLRYVLTQNELNFMLWTVLGALGSALAFAITVVSLPLLVERDVTTKLAILTSIKAVGNNPVTMLWWAMIIMIITGLSFITGMLGFIILYPLLGHASWHVYREVVDAENLPLRAQAD
jgi:uncharacterized membrane protein